MNTSNHAHAQKKYEECFRQWYTDKFLRGQRSNACADEWEVRVPRKCIAAEYHALLNAALKVLGLCLFGLATWKNA